MIKKLQKKFVSNAFIIIMYMLLRRFFSFMDDSFKKILGKKPVLYLLEYHVAEHCNMGCNSCFHFSSLVKEKIFSDLEQFKSDMTRLGELFGNIKTIRLMGGEPFLNKDLPQFIYQARLAFPQAKIHILTNGLLYKKLDGELLQAVLSNNAAIHVSVYKPMINKKNDMEQFFVERGVQYWISNPILQFAKYINISGNSNPKKAVAQCPASRCTFLSQGHIARCPLPANIKHFNKFFGQSINMDHELIDIHAARLDGFELKRRLAKPMSSCRYCGKLEWVDWNQVSENVLVSYTVSS